MDKLGAVSRREPELFGDYRLFGKIAAGGMASVFLAQHRNDSDQWLAIKRVHPHLTTREDVRQMFLNEAQILSRLDHPNICGIIDYGIHDDLPYIVMRYLHGQPLSGLIRRMLDLERKLPIELMAHVAACVCEGLHYAHEIEGEDGPLGLVHRDISPQNIFITFGGEVKLLDFGVAKAAGYQGLTRTGHIKGKYAYMSPEQVEAQPLDRRSDIFSLGIVLWESLTGRHLFKRKREIDTLRAIAQAMVPAVSELNPDVPSQLDQIVAKALVANVAYRFQTAKEMGDALWKFLTATQVPMGADEVAETMAEVFPDAPKLGQLWPNVTQLEVPALTETEAPPSSEDVSTGENPVVTSDDSLAQPTLQDLALAEIEPALADQKTVRAEDNTDEQELREDRTVPQPIFGMLMDRPAVIPHPFDPEHAGTLEPGEGQDTIVTDALQEAPIMTTIPREAISENPPEPPAGPTIQMPAQSINTEAWTPEVEEPKFDEPPTLDPPATDEREERRRGPVAMFAFLLVAIVAALAVVTYFVLAPR